MDIPESESKLTLKDLLEEGFACVTVWCPHGQRIKLETLEWPESSGWLYAFVVDDCVRYIGMTARVLRSRMDDYRHIDGEQTSRMRLLILNELAADRVVHVYGLAIADDAKRSAEEARLRIDFNPDWNRC